MKKRYQKIVVAALTGTMVLTSPDFHMVKLAKAAQETTATSSIATTETATTATVAAAVINQESNISYTFDETTGKLTINGKGDMPVTADFYDEGKYYCHAIDWNMNIANVKSIEIGEGITSIAKTAFADFGNLESIKLPSSLTKIEKYAFVNCSKLQSIALPEAVESIGENAFWNCNDLQSIYFGEKFASFGEGAIRNCPALSSIKISDKNQNFVVEKNGLYDVNKTTLYAYTAASDTVSLEATTTEIKPFALSGSKAKEIAIPDAVETIGGGAFYNAVALEKISFGTNSKLKEVKQYVNTKDCYEDYVDFCGAFENCTSLKSLALPNGVKSIQVDALRKCSNLEKLQLGSGFTQFYIAGEYGEALKASFIPEYIIEELSKLNSVTVAASNKTFTSVSGVLYTKSKKTLILYPRNKSGATYTLNKNTISIQNNALAFNNNITKFVSSANLKNIGGKAFYGNYKLQNFVGNKKISYIGQEAFSQSKKLKSIRITGSKQVIDQDAFCACPSLTSVSLPNAITLSYGALSFNRKLQTVSIPQVSTINDHAFSSCTSLKSISMPKATKIGESAFIYCSALTKVSMPKAKSLGENAFYQCIKLKKITVPNSVKTMGAHCIGYYDKNNKAAQHISGVKIYGKKNSKAYKYAKANKIKFVSVR